MKHLQSPSASHISDLRIPTSHFLQVGCSTLQLFLHSDLFLKLYTFPFPIFFPGRVVPMVTPPFVGGQKLASGSSRAQIVPFDSLPFSQAWLSLASCSIPASPAGGFPWKQPRKFEKRSTKGLASLEFERGEGGLLGVHLCALRKAPNLSSTSCWQFVNSFLFHCFLGLKDESWHGRGAGQGETSLFVNSGRQLWPSLSFSSPLEHFSLKTSHLLKISHSIRTQ